MIQWIMSSIWNYIGFHQTASLYQAFHFKKLAYNPQEKNCLFKGILIWTNALLKVAIVDIIVNIRTPPWCSRYPLNNKLLLNKWTKNNPQLHSHEKIFVESETHFNFVYKHRDSNCRVVINTKFFGRKWYLQSIFLLQKNMKQKYFKMEFSIQWIF